MWYTHQYASWGWGPLNAAFGPIGVGFLALLGAAVVLAILALKAYCLWHAAKRGEKWWFIFLLVLNTFGILEIVYALAILKKRPWQRHPSIAPKDSTEA